MYFTVLDCGLPRKFKLMSKNTACKKWCASGKGGTGAHIHGPKDPDCDSDEGATFHSRTSEDDSTVPAGKCKIITQDSKDKTKCHYLNVPKDKLELGKDTSANIASNEEKFYTFSAELIADGIITINSDIGNKHYNPVLFQ